VTAKCSKSCSKIYVSSSSLSEGDRAKVGRNWGSGGSVAASAPTLFSKIPGVLRIQGKNERAGGGSQIETIVTSDSPKANEQNIKGNGDKTAGEEAEEERQTRVCSWKCITSSKSVRRGQGCRRGNKKRSSSSKNIEASQSIGAAHASRGADVIGKIGGKEGKRTNGGSGKVGKREKGTQFGKK